MNDTDTYGLYAKYVNLNSRLVVHHGKKFCSKCSWIRSSTAIWTGRRNFLFFWLELVSSIKIIKNKNKKKPKIVLDGAMIAFCSQKLVKRNANPMQF